MLTTEPGPDVSPIHDRQIVGEEQDEITERDGIVTRSPSYWVMNGKPVGMIDANTFVVPESGERLILERSVRGG